MDKEKPFKLFPLPRLNTQVSAVKPQTVSGDECFFQGFNKCIEDDFNSPFRVTNTPNTSKSKSSDAFSQKVKHLPTIEEENLEPICQLYSKLYKEADKIKRWKGAVESEIKQKEKKLHDNTKTIEAQRKAIQELQFENEKLSLKLEDEIHENKDLVHENNATRHLCDLLKETCARSVEKTNMYDHEREESRQLYVELNSNIERMVMAFEELRVQAENSRLEMYFKLKEESEKRQQQEKNYSIVIHEKEEQVSVVVQQNGEKDRELMDIKVQLHESRNKIMELTEASRILTKRKNEQEIQLKELTDALEKIQGLSMEKENIERMAEELKETHKEMKVIIRVREEKIQGLSNEKEHIERIVEELKETHRELKDIIRVREENIQGLSNEKEHTEKIVEELKETHREMKDIIRVREETIQGLSNEKEHIERMVEELRETHSELKNIIRVREEEINGLKIRVTSSAEIEENCSKRLTKLEAELGQKENELKSLKKKMEREGEEVKNKLDESEDKTRNIETEISKKDKQLKTLENKLLTLKKQVENKNKSIDDLQQELHTLKKQVENKNKSIDALQQEVHQLNVQLKNSRVQYEGTVKSYKNLIEEKNTAEEKLCEEVNQLNVQLENSTVQYEETVKSYKNLIEEKNTAEERLCEEVEKLKLIAEEATKNQKETDIRCQHKIAEMVALMEKHKHQYDKMVEEKHTELGLYKTKEQETTSAKVSLEIELSYSKNEVLSLKEQLQKEIDEKERCSREVKEISMSLRKEMKHKITQTSILETPKHNSIQLNSKLVSSSSKSLPQNVTLPEHGKKSENNYISSWTPAKSALSTPRKTYTVKTPPKYEKVQKERINSLAEESSIKKRKVALAFDVNSDSSETTDLLSMVSEEDMFKKLYVDRPQAPQLCAVTPKKVYTSTLKSPGSALKHAAVRKMREAGWTAISNMDRKKKMKAAEKLFG